MRRLERMGLALLDAAYLVGIAKDLADNGPRTETNKNRVRSLTEIARRIAWKDDDSVTSLECIETLIVLAIPREFLGGAS